jgi:P pilus assembly chaperone PapD
MKILRALGTIALFCSSLSFADVSLSISPLKHELTINAGSEKSETIKVTNNSEAPITLYTSKEDFIA